MSNSEEEEIARNYICFGNPDATIVVLDATCIERNLNLVYQIMEITPNVIACVNLLDEAKKKKINIDLKKLEEKLGIPVVGTIAKKKKTLNKLMEKVYEISTKKIVTNPENIYYDDIIENALERINQVIENELHIKNKYLLRWISLKILDGERKILESIERNLNISILNNETINKLLQDIWNELNNEGVNRENIRDTITSTIIKKSEDICKKVVKYEDEKYLERDRKIDKILTSKKFGIPIMILFLGIILWITIIGANYPSKLLSTLFSLIGEKLNYFFLIIDAPTWIKGIIVDGMYKTLSWVVSVMLPPMAIFFPLFTLLEDLGVLPRIAFNLDKCFKKACTSRKTGIDYVHGTWLQCSRCSWLSYYRIQKRKINSYTYK